MSPYDVIGNFYTETDNTGGKKYFPSGKKMVQPTSVMDLDLHVRELTGIASDVEIGSYTRLKALERLIDVMGDESTYAFLTRAEIRIIQAMPETFVGSDFWNIRAGGQMAFDGKHIYFANPKDKFKLYKNVRGFVGNDKRQKISEYPYVKCINAVNDNVYFLTSNGNSGEFDLVHSANGKETILFSGVIGSRTLMFVISGKIFLADNVSGSLFEVVDFSLKSVYEYAGLKVFGYDENFVYFLADKTFFKYDIKNGVEHKFAEASPKYTHPFKDGNAFGGNAVDKVKGVFFHGGNLLYECRCYYRFLGTDNYGSFIEKNQEGKRTVITTCVKDDDSPNWEWLSDNSPVAVHDGTIYRPYFFGGVMRYKPKLTTSDFDKKYKSQESWVTSRDEVKTKMKDYKALYVNGGYLYCYGENKIEAVPL